MRSTFTVGGWISILRPLNSRKRQNEKAQSEDASVIDPRVRHLVLPPDTDRTRACDEPEEVRRGRQVLGPLWKLACCCLPGISS